MSSWEAPEPRLNKGSSISGRPFRSLIPSMKTVEKWKWRIRWAGLWTTTRIAMTEADIARDHPDATPVQGTRVLVELQETQDEIQAVHH